MFNRVQILFGALIVLVITGLLWQPWNGHADTRLAPFEVPNQRSRIDAIGPLDGLAPELQRAFTPDEQFAPIPTPTSRDWLAQHRESGQTYPEFARENPNRPNQQRSKIYFQPIGEFPPESSPDLNLLESFASAYFGLSVETLPAVEVNQRMIKIRDRGVQPRQLLSTDVLRWLETRLPDDAYCLLAITMEDLYPDASWNFVFGQASLRDRVGVYSFVRYSPEFNGVPRNAATESLMLVRSCKVLAHETTHMFGVNHCVYFHCLLNGSNSMRETDEQPMHLCPMCLRKLQSSAQFDVVKRYETLLEFSNQAKWTDESAWLKNRIDFIQMNHQP
jgi:archaemetzincin